ncbi:hypothetical protein SLS62_005066 [Diatrype stigma]|uniref:Zn(2)-C6 fungal-type domain-containing protein n=1 Tax=Diatrype stigma TaxID=117547 RepID=A0AAN9UTJ1_9PEZI
MTSLSGGEESGGGDMSLGAARQSCKECYRRKARCDKVIPACGPCMKYRRHCLYEKHSRTPLTRRHLTEVEEKLERAEALIKRLRRSERDEHSNTGVDQPISQQTHVPHLAEQDTFFAIGEQSRQDEDSVDQQAPPDQRFSERDVHAPAATAQQHSALSTGEKVGRFEPANSVSMNNGRAPTSYSPETSSSSRASTGLLEKPPQDDFEWDELDPIIHHQSPGFGGADGTEAGTGEEDQIKDGMASLAVDDKEAGYLGVASGAALLRILEPNAARFHTTTSSSNHSQSQHHQQQQRRLPSILAQPDINRHIGDAMIDSYFKRFHLSYPILHEPTFRAQYSEVIPQPHGRSWPVLAYVVAAIGVYSSAAVVGDLDLRLFEHAKSMLSFDFLEVGNLTLVQGLTLISNLQQKRDKPNSGYNYLGLAVRMAIGLGLHKEFPGWNISPLNMEIRRRVWWSLCVFDVGATITFSRPMVWPYDGVEVSFPLNVTDRELTANSKSYPPENAAMTPYTAVSTQARFHTATHRIYSRVISKPFPAAEELLELDAAMIQPWRASLPPYFSFASSDDDGSGSSIPAPVPPAYAMAHAVMQWRYRNLRIIMYRPFVIRTALNAREGREEDSPAAVEAYDRCLEDARITIDLISQYWSKHEHNRLAAWYALYFLFQAALIPCICLRNCPDAAAAPGWCLQISKTLQTIQALAPANASSMRCYQVILKLCGQYLRGELPPLSIPAFLPAVEPSSSRAPPPHREETDLGKKQQQQQQQQLGINQIQPPGSGSGTGLGSNSGSHSTEFDCHLQHQQPQQGQQQQQRQQQQQLVDEVNLTLGPIDESPQTQINHVFPMMWPNATALEAAEEVMGDDAWLEFLRGV